jgi:4-amino-4-deoxy-L-arabinose transferase-like glycosyltransferase
MSVAAPQGERPPLRDGLWVALLGLLVRVAVVAWAWGRVPPGADGKFYHVVAERIANGHGYTWLWPDGVVTYAAHYPIGYPALVGAAYALFGAKAEVAMLLNALVGSVAVLATHRVAARWSSRKLALVAAAFVALSPALAFYTPALMTEGLVATGLAGLAWLSLVVSERPRDKAWAAWGALVVVGGAVTLVRPQSILLLPVFGFVAAGASATWKRRAFAAFGVTLLAGACCLPWTARNCARMDRCVFVSANGGWNLLIGTFPEGQGAWVALDGERVPVECREVFEEAAKDHCFGQAGRRRVLDAPAAWLSLVPAKLRATFDFTASAAGYLREAGSPLDDRGRYALGAAEIVARRLLVLFALVAAFRLGSDLREGRRLPRALTYVRGAASLVGAAALFAMTAWVSHLMLLLVGATAGVLRQRPVLTLALGGVFVTVLVHGVFFGAGRYSMVLEPLLAPLAAIAFTPRVRGGVEPRHQF